MSRHLLGPTTIPIPTHFPLSSQKPSLATPQASPNPAPMENPLLEMVIRGLPLLADDVDLAQSLLDLVHADIDRTELRLGEVAAQLEQIQGLALELEEMRLALPVATEELLTANEASFHALLRQQRHLTQAVQVLLVLRAAAYTRSRSHLVPGVLLAAASAAVAPGFRTFVRFSVLVLGFLFASGRGG